MPYNLAPRLLRFFHFTSVRTQCHHKMIVRANILNLIPRLHILCCFLPVLSCLAYVSGALAGTSLLTGIFLIHRHEGLEVAEAHTAVCFIFSPLVIQFLLTHFISKHTSVVSDLITLNSKALQSPTPFLEYSYSLVL